MKTVYVLYYDDLENVDYVSVHETLEGAKTRFPNRDWVRDDPANQWRESDTDAGFYFIMDDRLRP